MKRVRHTRKILLGSSNIIKNKNAKKNNINHIRLMSNMNLTKKLFV